ncbi:MAG: c-type cytochrome domain-containing protein, partial [Vicinamibacterales bacterium]
MRIRVLLAGGVLALFMAALAAPSAQQPGAPAQSSPAGAAAATPAPQAASVNQGAQYKAVLDKYCVTCHNDRARTGGLTLQDLDVTNLPAHGETWEKVIRRVDAGMMPPQGMPRPDAATQSGMITWVKATLDRAAAERPNPGRALLRRLNRAEYANAVRD